MLKCKVQQEFMDEACVTSISRVTHLLIQILVIQYCILKSHQEYQIQRIGSGLGVEGRWAWFRADGWSWVEGESNIKITGRNGGTGQFSVDESCHVRFLFSFPFWTISNRNLTIVVNIEAYKYIDITRLHIDIHVNTAVPGMPTAAYRVYTLVIKVSVHLPLLLFFVKISLISFLKA